MTRYTPQWLQSGSYAAAVDRRLIGALWPAPATSGGAATPGAGGGMTVDVAPGQAAIPTANATGSVLCTWDAPETVTLDPSPPSGTNRVDLVIVQARGADLDGGTNNDFVVTFAKGVDGGGAPAVPANALAIAQVAVTGGAAAIVAGNITDKRPGLLAIPAVDSWKAPRGYVAQFTGPPSDIVGTNPTWTAGSFPVVANRRYRIHAHVRCKSPNAGVMSMRITPTGILPFNMIWEGQNTANAGVAGWGTDLYIPTATGQSPNYGVFFVGGTNATIIGGSGLLFVEDIGGY